MFLPAILLVLADLSQQRHSITTTSAGELVLPVPGRDLCAVLTEHCGGAGGDRRAEQMCLKEVHPPTQPPACRPRPVSPFPLHCKSVFPSSTGTEHKCLHCTHAPAVVQSLEALLPNSSAVALVRAHMDVPDRLYFLCDSSPFVANLTAADHNDTAPAAGHHDLTALLRRALRAAADGGGDGAMAEYRAAARWSALRDERGVPWDYRQKAAHFLAALGMRPDHLHAIDRLATALAEAGAAGQPAALRARAMLLHYALLRGLVQHPLQSVADLHG